MQWRWKRDFTTGGWGVKNRGTLFTSGEAVVCEGDSGFEKGEKPGERIWTLPHPNEGGAKTGEETRALGRNKE